MAAQVTQGGESHRLALAVLIWGFLVPARHAVAQFIPVVEVKATSEQVPGLSGAQNMVNDRGLTETSPGSSVFQLTDNPFADDGCMWNSAYLPIGGDENPMIQFDLGRVATVARFRIWNYNGKDNPSRGFKNVSIYFSADGKTWKTVAQRFRFAQAPGKPGYKGEEYSFSYPVSARYLRFQADSTYRIGGTRELAGLGKVRFVAGETVPQPAPARGIFPDDAGIVNVKDSPYNATGDGHTDDTAALQQAITDFQGSRRIIYLPDGSYLVSRSLRCHCGVFYGNTNIRGESQAKTVIRLKDGALTNPKAPIAVLFTGFNGKEEGSGVSADWFNNNVSNLTIDTGKGNAGAIGLQFYSNNAGAIRNVTIRSGDGQGVIGLDLGFADQNGPLLVKNATVSGFSIGVKTGGSVNSQTFEQLSLRDQRTVGFQNDGQCLSIRGLKSVNCTPAFRTTFGVVVLVDAELNGTGTATEEDAVINGEVLFARNVRTSGYRKAIRNNTKNGTPSPVGPVVAEFVSSSVLTLYPTPPTSLNLPIKESPETTQDDPANWANVRHFRLMSDPDDTAALQRAIDSGAGTIYFPPGAPYFISGPVLIRGDVRRLLGMFSQVIGVAIKDRPAPAFRVIEGTPSMVFLEGFISDVSLEAPSPRTLVVQDFQGSGGTLSGDGEVFLENVVGDWVVRNKHVWGRQLNSEKEGTHLVNDTGTLWILGLKTERGGTLVETRSGGQTELLGGLCYTTSAGKLAPMFVLDGGALSVTVGEVCYTGNPFMQLIRQSKDGKSKELSRGQSPLRPAFLQGSALPLYVGRP